MAKVNLSGMTVEALMDLRKRVDETLHQRRAELEKQLERMGAIAVVGGRGGERTQVAALQDRLPAPSPGDESRLRCERDQVGTQLNAHKRGWTRSGAHAAPGHPEPSRRHSRSPGSNQCPRWSGYTVPGSGFPYGVGERTSVADGNVCATEHPLRRKRAAAPSTQALFALAKT